MRTNYAQLNIGSWLYQTFFWVYKKLASWKFLPSKKYFSEKCTLEYIQVFFHELYNAIYNILYEIFFYLARMSSFTMPIFLYILKRVPNTLLKLKRNWRCPINRKNIFSIFLVENRLSDNMKNITYIALNSSWKNITLLLLHFSARLLLYIIYGFEKKNPFPKRVNKEIWKNSQRIILSSTTVWPIMKQSGRVGGERLLCIVVVYKSSLIGYRMSPKLMLFDKLLFANSQHYAPRLWQSKGNITRQCRAFCVRPICWE